MHIPPMLPQMILPREPRLAHAPAPFLRAVVAGRDIREMGGVVPGEVEGAGELASAGGVEAGVWCYFRCRGGAVSSGDGRAIRGEGLVWDCLFGRERSGEEERGLAGRKAEEGKVGGSRERKKIGIGARKGRRRQQDSRGQKDYGMTESRMKRRECPTLNHC